ncbi:MAG: hypothetical protein ACTHKA_15665 [Anaerocolumna jejuensis]
MAVLGIDRDERVLNAPNIKWIHYDHAGSNRIARPEVLEKDLIITSSAGRSDPALAEHALYFMLSFTFAFPYFYKAQLLRLFYGVHRPERDYQIMIREGNYFQLR